MDYQQMLAELRREQFQLCVAEQTMARIGPHPNNPDFQDDYDIALARAIDARNSLAELETALRAEEEVA